MKTNMIETPNGRIAAHEFGGAGPAAVLIHGNSSSARAFSKQLDAPVGERFRLVAIDLPGHGVSDNKKDPALYSIKNQARSLRAAIDALGLAEARFVGWSMGGHFALELAPDLPRARLRHFRRAAARLAADDGARFSAPSGDARRLRRDDRPR